MKSIAALMLLMAFEGKTPYRIVVSDAADASTKAVVQDMAGLLHEITGATFPVVTDAEPTGEREIIIGHDNRRLASLNLASFVDGFAEGEYEIRTVGNHLVIAGAPNRGNINGMYGFLQDHLGCRFFTPGVTRIPRQAKLEVSVISDRRKPAFRWRSTNPPMHWDAGWTARNRLNECQVYGGATSMAMLMDDPRVQSIENYYSPHAFSYVPDELFKEHPEYYAQVDSRRACAENPNERAYCLTNSSFAAYMADVLEKELKGTTGPHRVGLGHADNGNYCRCPICKAGYDRVGASGVYMEFDNAVADIVARRHPQAIIGTLAYGVTYAPSSVAMRPNVYVTWCPISECYAHGFDACDVNRDRAVVKQLQQWLDNTRMLGVWYYQYQSDMLMPHPKLHAMKRNFALFQSMGVDGVFVEDNAGSTGRRNAEPDGDALLAKYGNAAKEGFFTVPFGLNHIRSYINTQLMWDTGYDVERGIRDFCETYYGPAGGELAEFVLLVESVDSYARTVGRSMGSYPGVHMSNSHAPVLRLDVLEGMDVLFDAAEAKVAADATLLRRVQLARMTVQLAILSHAPADHPLRPKAMAMFPLAKTMGFVRLDRTGITFERVTFEQLEQLVSDPTKLTIRGQEPVGANLLTNSDFETEIDGDGIPDGWSATGSYLPEEYQLLPQGVRLDSSKAFAGKRSTRLTMAPAPKRIVALRQRFDVTPGASYRASVRYQCDLKAGSVHLMFTAFDKDGRWLRHQGGARGVRRTGEQWSLLAAETQAQSDTAQLMVEFLFHDDQAEGDAWIDDFQCAAMRR